MKLHITCMGIALLSSITMAMAVPMTDDIIDRPQNGAPSLRSPSARIVIINGIPMDRCYLLCCPVHNKEDFAQWLKNTGTNLSAFREKKRATAAEAARVATAAEAIAQYYRTYLTQRHKKGLEEILTEAGENPAQYTQEIENILPIFRDMYQGIIQPVIFGGN